MNSQKTIEKEYSAQAQKIGTSQSSWFLGADQKDRGLWGREWPIVRANAVGDQRVTASAYVACIDVYVASENQP